MDQISPDMRCVATCLPAVLPCRVQSLALLVNMPSTGVCSLDKPSLYYVIRKYTTALFLMVGQWSCTSEIFLTSCYRLLACSHVILSCEYEVFYVLLRGWSCLDFVSHRCCHLLVRGFNSWPGHCIPNLFLEYLELELTYWARIKTEIHSFPSSTCSCHVYLVLLPPYWERKLLGS